MAMIDWQRLSSRIFGHPVPLLIIGIAMTAVGGMAGGFLAQGLARAFPDSYSILLLRALIYVSGITLGYFLFVRYVERKPFSDFGLPGAGKELSMGIFTGFAAMSATIAVIAALGGYTVIGTNGPLVLVPVLAMALTSGIGEEILLRGLIFRFLEKWLGSWIALALSALLFGFLHLSNPNATVLAAFAIALEAGVLLAAIYMVTRRLWAAIGLHAMWNFTQGGIYGAQVSGFDSSGILISKQHGSVYLTGGAFGPEASVPAMIVCTAVGLWFLYKAWREGRFVRASWHRFKSGEAAPVA